MLCITCGLEIAKLRGHCEVCARIFAQVEANQTTDSVLLDLLKAAWKKMQAMSLAVREESRETHLVLIMPGPGRGNTLRIQDPPTGLMACGLKIRSLECSSDITKVTCKGCHEKADWKGGG